MLGARRLFTEETHPLGIEVVSAYRARRISFDIAPDSDRNDNCNDNRPDNNEIMHTKPPLHTIQPQSGSVVNLGGQCGTKFEQS
jgi:hypothetical protein